MIDSININGVRYSVTPAEEGQSGNIFTFEGVAYSIGEPVTPASNEIAGSVDKISVGGKIYDIRDKEDVTQMGGELLKRIQGTSEDSDASADPFKRYPISFSDPNNEGFLAALNEMHSNDVKAGWEGNWRVYIGKQGVEVRNIAKFYEGDLWLQIVKGPYGFKDGKFALGDDLKYHILYRTYNGYEWSEFKEYNEDLKTAITQEIKQLNEKIFVKKVVSKATDNSGRFISVKYSFEKGKEYHVVLVAYSANVAGSIINGEDVVQSLNTSEGILAPHTTFTASGNADSLRLYTTGDVSIDVYADDNIYQNLELLRNEMPLHAFKVYKPDKKRIIVDGLDTNYVQWASDHTGWIAITTGLKVVDTSVTFGDITISVTNSKNDINDSYHIKIPVLKNKTSVKTVNCFTDFDGEIKLATNAENRLVILLGGDTYYWRTYQLHVDSIDVYNNAGANTYEEYFSAENITDISSYTVFNNVEIKSPALKNELVAEEERAKNAEKAIKPFICESIPLALTSKTYYDSNLVRQDLAGWKSCEVDISQYQGCLIKLKTKTRATNATGTIGYCGFVDEDGNKIHSFTGRYLTSVMEDDTIVLPVPRAFSAYNAVSGDKKHPDRNPESTDLHSFKGAAKLRISSISNFECSLEIVTACNDNRLRGKNIAVLGSSNAALYFNGECRTNKGWFLYHLAPLFGYNCSVRNVGGSGWGDIPYQFEECKADIATTGKDYFDVVYLAETTNDGIGNFIDDYNHYIQGFCKELLYSGNDSIDSGLNEYCKTAANSIKEILNNSPRARMYIPMQFFNSNDYVEGKGALYLGQELKYENNFLKALCDVFNIKKISYSNGSSYRVWKEGPWYVWQGQSNGNSSDIKSGQQVLDQGDGIHASKPRGGWDMFKVFFSNLWNDFAADAMFN